jgi:histidinol-phosphate/aromatic aminotransferase/cobyric acid decarboxylase-like protein
LSQVNVFPTEANFVLLQHKTLKADEIARRCATQNVLIREAHNFVGLDDSYFRVAFRSTEGLSRLLSVLREAETAS